MINPTSIQGDKVLINLVDSITLPYQVTQLKAEELSVLENKFYELSDREKKEIVKIAEEIFESEMPPVVKEGRWFYCLMYGVIEFLQEQQSQYKANKTASA